MAARAFDSVQGYAAGANYYAWHYWNGVNVLTSPVRSHQTYILEFAFNERAVRIFDHQQTWIIGFSAYFDNMGAFSNFFIEFKDLENNTIINNNDFQCAIAFSNTGIARVCRATEGTILESSPSSVLSFDEWHYIEIKVVIGNSGSYEVRVDNVEVFSNTGIDLQDSSNSTANCVSIGRATAGSTNIYIGDIYIFDGSGSEFNDFLGPVKIEALLPNGAGNYSQFTPSAGSNYQNVDEARADADTTYNESSTAGNKDTFTFPNVSESGEIKAVSLQNGCSLQDVGPRTIRSVARISATDYYSSGEEMQNRWKYRNGIWRLNPNDSGAWEDADVNNAEFGYELET